MPYDFICKSAQLELEHSIMDAGYQTMERGDSEIGTGVRGSGTNDAIVDGDCSGHICCRRRAQQQ